MFTKVRTIRNAGERQAFTLVEVLIVIAIILVLLGLVMMASNTIRSSGKYTESKAQLAMLATAINQYAEAWPRWMEGEIVVADKGWPDFIPERLFAPPFNSIANFNDHPDFVIDDGVHYHAGEDRDIVAIGDVLTANSTLAYALTSSMGKGPFIYSDDQFMLKDVDDKDFLHDLAKVGGPPMFNPPNYPSTGGDSKRMHLLIDPWGTPYRYFWVYRDAAAYNGYMPVETWDTEDNDFERAIGYVLESAGPDRKFGNRWQESASISGYPSNINDPDILDAEDNIIVQP